MAEIFGHRWTSAYGTDPQQGAGGTWSKGLAGLSVADIARGVEACIAGAMPWPPTLPEFRELCLGIPSLPLIRVYFARIRDGSTSGDPFARLVWTHIDSYAYRVADKTKADRMIADAYVIAREQRMRGEPLPGPSPELEHQRPAPPKPASPEVAKPHMDDLRRALYGDRQP